MDDSTASSRSTFVTGLAWVFIVLAGCTTFISILQNIMIALMFPPEAMSEAANADDVPAFAKFMFAHPHVFFGAFLTVSAAMFVSAIGLLKRRNWARLVFITILALAIVWNLGGLVFMYSMFSSMSPMLEGAPTDFQDGFDTIWKVMMGFSVVMALAFCGLFGWIIKRLGSPEIKREFIAL